jgi:hypothetical protein
MTMRKRFNGGQCNIRLHIFEAIPEREADRGGVRSSVGEYEREQPALRVHFLETCADSYTSHSLRHYTRWRPNYASGKDNDKAFLHQRQAIMTNIVIC